MQVTRLIVIHVGGSLRRKLWEKLETFPWVVELLCVDHTGKDKSKNQGSKQHPT